MPLSTGEDKAMIHGIPGLAIEAKEPEHRGLLLFVLPHATKYMFEEAMLVQEVQRCPV